MWGLRNPWRFSLDRKTHDMWIGDVGQDAWEEIDYAKAGAKGINWGWPLREGKHPYDGAPPPGARDPILERSHNSGDCAITGGYVYRGTAIKGFQGTYVFGDTCTGELRAIQQRNGKVVHARDLKLNVASVSSFGESPSGEIYAASLNGLVYRHQPRLAHALQRTTRSRAASAGLVQPVRARAFSSSSRSRSSSSVTPAAPEIASAHRYGRPINTARAPRHSARSTSRPVRMPPSTSTGTGSATAAIFSSTKAVGTTPSSWRAPWFDTMTPAAPCVTAARASSGRSTPFTRTGQRRRAPRFARRSST